MAIVINGTGTIAGVSATGITTAPTNATDASKLPKAGGQMTGNITFAAGQTVGGRNIAMDGSQLDTNTSAIATNVSNISSLSSDLDDLDDAKLNLSGGTLTGNVSFGNNNEIRMGGDTDLKIYHDHANSQNVFLSTSIPTVLAVNDLKFANGSNDTLLMVIKNDGKVGIGIAAPSEKLHLYKTSSAGAGLVNLIKVQTDTNNTTGDGSAIAFHGKLSSTEWGFGKIGGSNSGANYGGALEFHTNPGNGSSASVAYTKQLTIMHDGRGLSQFTAKAWVNFNGTGTVAIRDSHNVSSITDIETGGYRANFSNNMANANYAVTSNNTDTEANGASLNPNSYATSSITLYSRNGSGTIMDGSILNALVFGD